MAAEVQAEIYWTLQIKVEKKEGKQSTIQWLLAQVLNTKDSPFSSISPLWHNNKY